MAKKKEDVVEVEAEVIEEELTSPLSGAEKWLAEKQAIVEAKKSEYKVFSVSTTEENAHAKKDRAALNGIVRDIDSGRKSMTRTLNDALKTFKLQADTVASPLAEIAQGLDANIKAFESGVVADRKAMLREFFEDSMPYIALPTEGSGKPLTEFDTVVERFGMGQLGDKWLNYGTNDEKARLQLEQAIQKIAETEQTIEHRVNEQDWSAVKATYFATLDLEAALTEADRIEEQRKRVVELEAQRAEDEREQQELLAKAQAEVEGMPEPQVPAPQPVSEPQVPVRQPVPAVPPYIVVAYCDEAAKDAFRDFCIERGIARHVEHPTNGNQYKLTRI